MADSIYEFVGGGVTIGDAISGGSANQILFGDASTNVAQSPDLFFDETNIIFNVGDTLAAANETVFTLDDQNSIIRGQTDGTFIVRNSAAASKLSLDMVNNIYKLGDVTSAGNDTLLTVDDANYTINLSATDGLQSNNLFVNNLSAGFNVFDLVASDSTVFSAIPTQSNITTTDFSTQDQAIISTNGSGAAFIQGVNGSTFASGAVFATKSKAELRFDTGLPLTTGVIVNATNLRIGNYDGSGNSTLITVDDTNSRITVSKPFGLKGYTVATLPTGFTGATAYVTDALAPAFGSTVVGGGAVVIKVFYNGSNRIVG